MKITEWLDGPGKDACDPAKEWLKTFPEGALMSEVWAKCHRVDWMFWAGFRSPTKANDPRWRQAAFAIVRRTEVAPEKTNWDIMPEAARRCVEAAERYESGDATKEERSAAESAAESAAWSQQADILREYIADPWADE